MSTRIEIVDPVQFAGIASEILQAAWKPPCLNYSLDYLSWQFAFPRTLSRIGVIAYLDDRPAGCIAVTPRLFVNAGQTFAAYVLSFLAVHPSAGRRGIASGMYTAILEAIPRDTPTVVFFEPGSTAEGLLLQILKRASFRLHTLLPCRAIGFMPRAGTPAPSTSADETTDYEAFLGRAQMSTGGQTIYTHINREYWDHYRNDPRGRTMVVLHDERGNQLGTAMLVNAEVLSVHGVQRVPMLESVALPTPTPAPLSALFQFAASRAQPGSTVIASNLSHIDTALIRAAGARALPSSFNAHAFVKGEKHVIETADAVNLEVI
jgi:hypothetical protein